MKKLLAKAFAYILVKHLNCSVYYNVCDTKTGEMCHIEFKF